MTNTDRETDVNDDDLMPWGKYVDYRLADVPDHYWLWFLEQPWCDHWPALVRYANLCVEDDDE